MRWWTLPAMLLCLAAGYLLGAGGTKREPERAPRGAHVDGIPEERAAPVAVAAPVPARAPDSLPADIAVAMPDPLSTTEDPEDEWGTLVVDFTGFDGPPCAYVEAKDIEGDLTYCWREADDDHLASFGLYPGEVLVRWEDHGAMRRFAARARIETGRVTRILAADPRHAPLPDLPGFAVLDVHVAGADGASVPDADVSVVAGVLDTRSSLDVPTDGEGRARFRVRPGPYQVEAGDLHTPVTLGPGERRTLELRHEAPGEVIVDPTLLGTYLLRRRDTGTGSKEVVGHGGAARFSFVAPGAYHLFYTFSAGEFFGHSPNAQPETSLLATVEVRAGRVERLAHQPEPGFLEVEIDAGGVPASRLWQMRLVLERDKTEAALVPLQVGGGTLRGRTGTLPKGCYRVEILSDGNAIAERYVVIGYGPTRLHADLSR